MLIDKIKAESLAALKEKNHTKRAIYSVIINKYTLAEIEGKSAGKQVGDDELVKIIQKTIKELEEEGQNFQKIGNLEELEKIQQQKAILDEYLPEMLSEDEIRNIILPLEDKSIPSVMRYFKTHYNGKCDMRLVAEVLKKL